MPMGWLALYTPRLFLVAVQRNDSSAGGFVERTPKTARLFVTLLTAAAWGIGENSRSWAIVLQPKTRSTAMESSNTIKSSDTSLPELTTAELDAVTAGVVPPRHGINLCDHGGPLCG